MPFTFAHPALVLPLNAWSRKWFSLTGLVVGSLTPDFEYFLRMRLAGHFSHTLPGILFFDLPIGLLLAFVFHNIVRNSLLDNLPRPLASRLSPFKNFNWNEYFRRNWLVVLISILIGTGSHIFWDGFTHWDGFFVQRMPALGEAIIIQNISVQVFRILQHASTVVGFITIGYAIYQLPASKTVKSDINLKYWGIIAGIGLAVLIIRLITGLDYRSLGEIVVNVISAGMIGLIFTPIILQKENSL